MKKFLKLDKQAITTSFFFKKKNNVLFNQDLKNDIIKNYKKNNSDLRVCLHQNPLDKHHDMIILQQKKNFYKPHKHKSKAETYHMISGKMIVIIFKNDGKILNSKIIGGKDVFRVPSNTFHTMIPLTKYVIYHENKNGPFIRKGDSIYPNWINKFPDQSSLLKKLK